MSQSRVQSWQVKHGSNAHRSLAELAMLTEGPSAQVLRAILDERVVRSVGQFADPDQLRLPRNG